MTTARGIAFILVGLLAGCADVDPDGSPLAILGSPEYDAGSVAEGAIVEHTFTLQNTGRERVQVEKLATSCGCVSAEIGQEELKPGASTWLMAVIRADGVLGRHETVNVVYSDGRDRHVLSASVSVDIRTDMRLEVTPRTITSDTRLLRQADGELPRLQVSYYTFRKDSPRVRVEAPNWLEAQLEHRNRVAHPGELFEERYVLCLRLDSWSAHKHDVAIEPMKGMVMLHVEDDQTSSVEVPLEIREARDFVFKPETAYWSSADRVAPATKIVQVTRLSDSSARIVTVGALEGGWNVRTEETETGYLIHITPPSVYGADLFFSTELEMTVARGSRDRITYTAAGKWDAGD